MMEDHHRWFNMYFSYLFSMYSTSVEFWKESCVCAYLIPCGLGCSGGRRPETLPFTPVRLLLLNLYPRLNFSLWRLCSSGLWLPTAAEEKRRMGIKWFQKQFVLSNCLEAILCANFSWVEHAVLTVFWKIHSLCRSEMQEICFLCSWYQSGLV